MVLTQSIDVPLGTKCPDFMLQGVDEKMYSLIDFAGKEVLVVVFMCNHCPYVQAIWSRLNELQSEFLGRGVQFVGINPNLNPDYPEEDLEHMKKYYADYGMNFPYLLDEAQYIVKKFQAQCTPDIFVYDAKRELVYHGRVDDNWKEADKVKERDLRDFLFAHLSGTEFSREQKPSMGCSIKWRN